MSDIKGKIVLKTPFICECCIRSDRVYKTLNSFKNTMVELSAGKHMINVGIGYDEMPESSRVYSADTWAWESDKAIEIGENALLISIKRKWHLFRPVTVEAEIIK